ncbi:MAG: hypothetical protein MJ170_03355 [Alphaproteobacteria bacterium]|nr:hypothetical protein [Alphaproteobacteria bacterium]
MKRLFLILCLITICNISYADIASVGYVDGVVATKQDTIPDIATIRTGAGLGATAVQPSTLSTVAKTGSYNDLSNKPTIPTVPTTISSFTNDSGYITTSYHDSTKQDKLPTGPSDGKKYSLIWNGNGFSFEEFTTGGDSTPIDWDAIDEYLSKLRPSGYASYGLDGQHCVGMDANYDLFGVDAGGSCSDPEFAGMVAGDWYVDIPEMNTKIEGRALCSSTNGTYASDPDGSGSGDTRYCWCKITSPAASRWLFFYDDFDADDCAFYCAYYCGNDIRDFSDVRSVVFGSIGQ